MKKRLSKILQEAGIASRRKAELIITAGRVTVNKEIILIPQTLADLAVDTIEIDGERLKGEKKVYYLLNKPVGFLCTSVRRIPNTKLVLDLFSHLPYRLFTVGRLDKETSGLLIVTNDGNFANKVIHPSFGVTKEYLAKTDTEVLPEHLYALTRGTYIDGVKVTPIKVQKVRKGTLKIVIGEGKKREVRILLERAGLEVNSLCRIRLGSCLLGNLPVGHFRELSFNERESLEKES